MFQQSNLTCEVFQLLAYASPAAYAMIAGSPKYPSIRGSVYFYPFKEGTLFICDVAGVPGSNASCSSKFLGFHIHEGANCSGNAGEPFSDVGGHYNPTNCPHPFHKGDLPVLLSDGGMVWSAVYTSRFTPDEIIAHTVIIHDMPDDYRSQPSGDSMEKIACGQIVRCLCSKNGQ